MPAHVKRRPAGLKAQAMAKSTGTERRKRKYDIARFANRENETRCGEQRGKKQRVL
jgi:hypothetical protein